MKKLLTILVMVAVLFCGCGETTTGSGDDKKPNTSCALPEYAESTADDLENQETNKDEINLDAKSGQEAIENAMKAVKNLDKEGVSRYLGEDLWEWSIGAKDSQNFKLIEKAFPYMTYEFIKVEDNGEGTVNAWVKISAVDLGLEFVDVQMRLEDWYQAMALEELEVTYEGRQNELYRIFNSELDDVGALKYCVTEIVVQAYKPEGSDSWQVARSDDLVRAIFGTVTWGMGMG